MRARRIASASFVAVLAFAAPARAGGTLDLLWLDTGTPTLVTSPGDPGSTGCGGFNNPAPFQADTRCLQILFTADEGWTILAYAVSFGTSLGLTALHATQFLETTAGPVVIQSLGPPTVDNGSGEITDFTVSTPPPNGPPAIPPGTYLLGTIVFDLSAVAAGTHPLASLFLPGSGGFVDGMGEFANERMAFHGATLVTPEPASVALLLAGLLGLAAALRNR